MTQETVTISKEHYEALVDSNEFLESLRVCGVDNWQGYDDACELYQEWQEDGEE